MLEKEIFLRSIDDVKEFVAIASKYDGNIDIKAGRYVVDAKSILGIFSLDISNSLNIALDMKKSEAEKFCADIDKFIVK